MRARRRHASLRRTIVAFFVVLSAAVILGSWFLRTSAGAAWAVHRGAAYVVERPSDFRVRSVSGSWRNGIILEGIVVKRPKDAKALKIEISRARIRASLSGLSMRSEGIVVSSRFSARPIRIRSVEGEPFSYLVVRRLDVEGLQGLPAASRLRVQRARVAFPYGTDSNKEVFNGRLSMKTSEPILFFGTQRNGRLDLEFFARKISLPDVLRTYVKEGRARHFDGSLRRLHAFVKGTPRKPDIFGNARFRNLSYRGVRGDGLAAFALHPRFIAKPRRDLRLYGTVLFKKGSLVRRSTRITIKPGAVRFSGEPRNVSLDLHGSSKIEETRIWISVRGTSDKPDLRLRSQPPLSKVQILVMLATGREWEGTAAALDRRELTADAIKEFADYLVFGGSIRRLLRSIGITDLELILDEGTRGFEFTKELTSKFDAIVGLTQDSVSESRSQKLGAEYSIDRDTTLRLVGEFSEAEQEGSFVEGRQVPQESVMLKLLHHF